MKKLILFYLAVVSVMFIACEEGETPDIVAPEINITSPTTSMMMEAGKSLSFNAVFSDDEALGSFSIAIHNNFDGHSHGRLLLSPFSFNQTYENSGVEQNITKEITVANDATAGPYHFTVEAIDAAGNATSFANGSSKELELWLVNEEMAMVHFHDASGDEIDEYDAEYNTSMSFYGIIEDQAGTLDHVVISVGHLEESESGHEHSRVYDEALFEAEFEVEGQQSVMIQDLLSNSDIIVSSMDVEADEHLFFIIESTDADGNISRSALPIHFE